MDGKSMIQTEEDIKLLAWVNTQIGLPFVKSETDCNILALKTYDIYKGTDLTSKFFGKYKTYTKGKKLAVAELGFGRFANFLEENATEIPVHQVSIGDILVKKQRGYDACTICLGNKFLDADMTEGVVKLNRYKLIAFRGFRAFRL